MSRTTLRYRAHKARARGQIKQYIPILLTAGAVLVAVLLTVIWGNIWGERAQASAQARAEARAQAAHIEAQTPDWLPAAPPQVALRLCARTTGLDEALSELTLLHEAGENGASIPLYVNGAPAYSSPAAQAMGRQSPGATDLTLTRLRAGLPEGFYLSATMTCTWQDAAEESLRHLMATYEATLAAELGSGGADEILLLGLGITSDEADEIALFLRDIRIAAPEAVIGVAVPTAVMLDGQRMEILQTLLTYADFVALDLRDCTLQTINDIDEETGEVTRRAATAADIVELLRTPISVFRMRLLFPTSMTAEFEAMTDIQNRQLVP